MRHKEIELTEQTASGHTWVTSPVQEIVAAAMRQDQSAYRALDRRLSGPLARHLRKKLGADAGSVNELATQAISEALQAIATGRYDPRKARFVTFLYAVAHNVGLRFLYERGKVRVQTFSSLPENALAGVRSVNSDGVETVMSLTQIEAMRDCLRADDAAYSLTAEERFVISGRAQGKTFQTLSRQLGRALDTVHRASRRAIAKLRNCLTSKGHGDL